MDLEQLKNKLKKDKEEIEAKIVRLSKVTDFGSDVDSLEEEASETEEFGNQLAIAQELKKRLADIDLALNKMEKGIYGICEKCRKEISPELLEVAPESKLCSDCKKAA